MKLLNRNKRTISYEIDFLKEILSIMEMYHNHIIDGINADEDEIAVCKMPQLQITMGETTNFKNDDSFYNEYLAFCISDRTPKLNLSYPIGGYFDSFRTFLDHPSEPTCFFSLDPDGRDEKEKGLYLVGYTRGYYGQANDLPERMKAYADKHNIEFDGPVYCNYLFDEVSTSDPDQYLLQVAASVKELHYDFIKDPHHHFING
jgi:hypothetical protein